ncbi:hypothetical protein K4A83_04800 [Spirulina subsalsa FACHB-351]|uniref:Uncharacterized protein n=1 Tax=Spirulina subsalsa FACHB-351 TaxID=234711 RepID=A0ABT3L327_9CYAN|nr:hypothetical protein [Spirulina subsalsa]MCW6035592.1 hypothetical protein [Spirulina subsalsa FACHB-351]
MKQFIDQYEMILGALTCGYERIIKEFTIAKHQVKERLDKLILEVLGQGGEAENYKSISDSFLEREGVELIDPINLLQEIQTRQSFVQDFKSNIDRVLSISNARTMIEVED